MKALSFSVAFATTFVICVYGGFKLGSSLDDRFVSSPIFTVIGTLLGIGTASVISYFVIYKHLKAAKVKEIDNKQLAVSKETTAKQPYPIIDVSIDEVRQAIRKFSDQLPNGVYRTILVKEDHSIDFNQLAPILGGIPAKKFYMSKETYDIFEENEKHIPPAMDMVQKAVDQYVKEHKEYPILDFDPERRVNYYQLTQEKFLKKAPDIQFYITDMDGLITHIKPKRKNTSRY